MDFYSYLITDPTYYSNNKKDFEIKLSKVLSKNQIDYVCFRDKESSNFEELAKIFVKVCNKFKIKNILINSNLELAKKLNVGIHLTSTQFELIKKAKKENLFTIISCHNEDDINKAIERKIDAITYSPIFKTPNKGEPKGVEKLESIVSKYRDLKIFALGGIINEIQIESIKKTKAYGFASIRYFI